MIALVTDSTAYFTKEEAEAIGVSVVPMHYIANGTQYTESYSDFCGDFEHLIDSASCKTSHPVPDGFMRVYDDLIKQGYEVLCIVMSSRLSGAYSSASIAARAIDSRIVVVDSLSTAGGLALLLKCAATLIREDLPIDSVAERLEKIRENVGITFTVESMEPLRRSNRIGVVPQAIGTILNIRPILLCRDGAVVSNGIARGGHEQIRRIVENISPKADELIIHYTNSHAESHPKAVEALHNAVNERFPNIKVSVGKLGPVIGIHLGSGAMGVSWIVHE